jgi:hypothetical protein
MLSISLFYQIKYVILPAFVVFPVSRTLQHGRSLEDMYPFFNGHSPDI